MIRIPLVIALLAAAFSRVLPAQFEDRGSFTLDGGLHPELVDGHRVRNIVRVGDLNGDAVPDFAIALYQTLSETEGILIVSGGDGSFVRRIDSPFPGNPIDFGSTIIGLPDVDGDGVDDLYVVARLQLNGTAHVMSGQGGSLTTLGPLAFFEVARQSLDLGDVDGDGGKWIALSVPDDWTSIPADPNNAYPDVGGVYVYRAQVGLGVNLVSVLHGEVPGQKFGSDIGSLGDVDGDGHEDIAVASLLPVMLGGSSFALPVGHVIHDIVTGAATRGENGVQFAKLDDVDGDGFSDYFRDGQIISGQSGVSLYATGAPGFRTCGDIDGDGIEDFGTDQTFRSGADGSQLVAASDFLLGGRGDHDGDGFDDAVFVTISFLPPPIPFDPPVPLHELTLVSACGAKRFGEDLGGMQTLDLNWLAGGQSDPAVGTVEITGAAPGALGLMGVSLAPANFDFLGLDVLVDNNPGNVVANLGFGFDLTGELSAPAFIRSPWVGGVSFYFQAFQTWPTLASSNGLELRFVPCRCDLVDRR